MTGSFPNPLVPPLHAHLLYLSTSLGEISKSLKNQITQSIHHFLWANETRPLTIQEEFCFSGLNISTQVIMGLWESLASVTGGHNVRLPRTIFLLPIQYFTLSRLLPVLWKGLEEVSEVAASHLWGLLWLRCGEQGLITLTFHIKARVLKQVVKCLQPLKVLYSGLLTLTFIPPMF